MSGKQPTYYVEENEKFLNLLISNCEPILNEIVSKFDNFNKINKIQTAFDQQMNNSYGEDLENEDILGPVADEFSIKTVITVKKNNPNNKLKKSQPTLSKQDPQF